MKTKWDLTHLYNNIKDWNNDYKKLEKEVSNYQDITNSKDLINKINELSNMDILVEKLYCYPKRKLDLNSKDSDSKKYVDDALKLYSKIEEYHNKLNKYVMENIDSINNKDYKRYIEVILRNKNHISNNNNYQKKLDDIKLKYRNIINGLTFNDIDIDGKLEKLTRNNYSNYLTSKNEKVRKEAFEEYTKSYIDNKDKLSKLFIDKYKLDCKYTKERNFKSLLQMKTYEDELPENIISNLIGKSNIYIYVKDKYIDYKIKKLNKDEIHIYDNYLSISNIKEYDIDYNDGVDLIKKALSPLGDSYLKEIDKILNDGWIDVYSKKNKRIMSFTSLSYSGSYVLINYENNLQSVRTLAHEIGHRINSEYSRKNNKFIYFDISLFLTEVASKVNEMLLNNYIIEKASDVELKKYILNDVILSLINSLFGQMMLTEFEDGIVNKIEKDEIINIDYINNKYEEIYKKYNSKIKYQDNIKYEWLKVPHFVMQEDYYLFKYTIGAALALNISDRILNKEKGFVQKYINFLKSGNSLSVIDTLKLIDIDINDSKYMDNAYNVLNNYIDKLINL